MLTIDHDGKKVLAKINKRTIVPKIFLDEEKATIALDRLAMKGIDCRMFNIMMSSLLNGGAISFTMCYLIEIIEP